MSGDFTAVTRRGFIGHAGAAAFAGGSLTFWAAAGRADTPDISGRWSPIYAWPDVGIHLHLLPSSTPEHAKLLSFSDDNSPTGRYAGSSESYVVNIPANDRPATTWMSVHNGTTNLFCTGHTFLPDGRLLAMGGHVDYNFYGSSDINIFTYGSPSTWQLQTTALNAGRWYASVISLPNREVLVISGTIAGSNNISTLPQVWETNDGSGLRDLIDARLNLKTYPKIFVVPDGRVATVGTEQQTRYLDTSGRGRWTTGPKRKHGKRNYGIAALYDDGKILMAGGADTNSSTPTNNAEVLDLNAGNPAWRWTNPMRFARKHANSTLLPDGKVLVTGGSRSTAFNDAGGAVFAAELWDPQTELWALMASAQVPRIYHSTALLLPDGRVLSAGGGRPKAKNGGTNNTNVEIFEPPYLFRGARPTVTAAPTAAGYGAVIDIETPNAADIDLVTLLRLGSVTHTFNMNQRINRVPFTRQTGRVRVTIPTNRNLLLPGHYLLFVLNGAGVPSIGRVIAIAAS